MTRYTFVLSLFMLFFFSSLFSQNDLGKCNMKLINAIMEDVFNPPVASRIHFYTNLAAYEVLRHGDDNYISLSGQIDHMPEVASSDLDNVNLDMAAEIAFLNTGLNFIYTEDKLIDFYNSVLNYWKKKLSKEDYETSLKYGTVVAKNVIEWSKGDNYDKTRTMHRYEINDSLGAWRPTPPEYANAMEPNWPFMRKLTFGENEFIDAKPNLVYSEDTTSQFFRNAIAVYNAYKTLTPAQKTIAEYWDDNPQTHVNKGHFMYVFKKPTPGGHWLKITTQIINELKMNNMEAAELYTMVCAAMYDAFINCWRTKYKTNAIRPITYLHRMGYTDFETLIETPNFPEYTSGHSAVSRAITMVLTHYIGDNYAFTDSAQIAIGLEPRDFKSFHQASDEVSVSRFCGGIHYMHALINGQSQGEKIGRHVLRSLKTQRNFMPKVKK